MTSIYSTSTAFTDIEKVLYADSTLTRTDSVVSGSTYGVSARAPTQYPDTPSYSPGRDSCADDYDTDSAVPEAEREVAWRAAQQPELSAAQVSRLDIPTRDPRYVAEPSPTIPVVIPTGTFRPFEGLSDTSRLEM